MKIENPYRCNVCQMAKGEANKWLLGIPIVNGSIRVGIETESDPQGLEPPSIKSGYILLDWDEEIAQNATGVHHLCSDRCALTNQARYLREDVKVRTA